MESDLRIADENNNTAAIFDINLIVRCAYSNNRKVSTVSAKK
jgi:hypothetical protein